MLSPRDGAGTRVRLLGMLLAAALAFAACTVQRTPAEVGPPFLRVVRVARLYDVPAVSPPAWAPRADALAFGTDDGVWQVPLDGTGPRRLASIRRVTSVAWGSARAALAAEAGGTLYIIDPTAAAAAQVAGSAGARLPEWAPRGGGLAYVEDGAGGDTLLLWTAGGRTRAPRRVALPAGFTARTLRWLPDGRDLLVAGGPPGGAASTRVLRVATARSTPTVVSVGPAAVMTAPTIDGAGTEVAYIGGTSDELAAGHGVVTVSRLNGTGKRALTSPGTYTGLAWAPSGRSLAFGDVLASDRVALEIVNAATGARLRVAEYRPELPQTDTELAIRWAPDGLRLAFGTDTGDHAGPVWVATLARE